MAIKRVDSTLFNNFKSVGVSDLKEVADLKIKSINKSVHENFYGDKYIKYTGNPVNDEVRRKSSPHLKSDSQASSISDSHKAMFENKSKNVSRKSIELNLKSVEIEEADYVEVNDEGDEIGKGYYYSPGSSSLKGWKNNRINNYIFEKYTNQSVLRKGALVNLTV
ncbi:MAG: hypothetical protein PVH88_25085 [Ignavibacteria bacterium]|jgi:hypothetical protein